MIRANARTVTTLLALAASSVLPTAQVCGQSAAEIPPDTGALFSQNCAGCHGSGAAGTDRAPSLLNNRRLRAASETDIANLIRNGKGNMPAFGFLAAAQTAALAHHVHSLNADAFDSRPEGDAEEGRRLFFGEGRCSECHAIRGEGGSIAPDLSDAGHAFSLGDLQEALTRPQAKIAAGYSLAEVTTTTGLKLQGVLRKQTDHALALQTSDGNLHLMDERDYTQLTLPAGSAMPAFAGTEVQLKNLIAFLSQQTGVPVGPAPMARGKVEASDIARINSPSPGSWPTYSGSVSGNRHSPLQMINVGNVSRLQPAWIYPLAYSPLETTPEVIDGVMIVTAPNRVDALDARSGHPIWSYSRPRSVAGVVSVDAAKGANRGVAILGNRLYFITDNAHLLCLNRLTGALMWEVALTDGPGHNGGTAAPLVAGDLVLAGVSGGDEAIRGFIAAYNAVTGTEAWRFWTVPKASDPLAATWKNDANPLGGPSWTTPSYDPTTGTVYAAVGNPYPDTNGDLRGGDNIYTDSDIALDVRTGKLRWYFQFTPHDVHDWDANQPIALVDASFKGKVRPVLLHANRNGFFYVLDRTSGKLLQASAFVKKLTWATGVGSDGRPVLTPDSEPTTGGTETCPAVRGATNWYSTAFNPSTNFYYVMAVEDCTIYRKTQDGGGYYENEHPADPPRKVLRALKVDGGQIAWEIPLSGSPKFNYSGTLSTAGGLVFFGESNGEVAAVDAATGKRLWHFESNAEIKGSPMTYTVNGRQFVSMALGSNIVSFALTDVPGSDPTTTGK